MFKRIFDRYPSKPAIIFAPIIMLIVLTYYYYSRYEDCSHHQALREQFYLLATNNQSINFSDLSANDWNETIIKTAYQPNKMAKAPDCPFGWDWHDDYRQQLIEAGKLNMVIFVKAGKPVDYIELEQDKVYFDNLNNPYTPYNARFSVVKDQNGSVLLEPQN